MRNWLRTFSKAEDGQDLIEYSLLIAFLALASAGLMVSFQPSVKQITNITTSNLSQASSVALGGS
jgi:Flp pilus assembly pilin Flp